MKIEEIKEQCQSLSDEELLMVVNNKIRYTELIVRVAQQEIRRRGVTKEDIKRFKAKEARRAKIIDGDIYEDIFLLEKIGFFLMFFFPRMHVWAVRGFRKRKFVLKIKSSKTVQCHLPLPIL